jgi:Restriction alleviation protein Lar
MPLRLLSCPFCDAQPMVQKRGYSQQIICPACGAAGPIGMDIADAVDKWNRCRTVEEVKAMNRETLIDAEGL